MDEESKHTDEQEMENLQDLVDSEIMKMPMASMQDSVSDMESEEIDIGRMQKKVNNPE